MAAVDYFLKIDGIDGESVSRGHKAEIDVEAWSWGETQSGSRAAGAGAAAGRVRMDDVSFTMKLNKASPKLFLACAGGEHIKAAWLTAEREAGDKADYFLKWTFSDLLVSSYQTEGSAGDAPHDQVTFSFGKVEVEYKEQKADGSFGAGLKAGWDLKANKKI